MPRSSEPFDGGGGVPTDAASTATSTCRDRDDGPRDPALATALDCLARRDYTGGEIRARVAKRFGDAAADATLVRLQELRLIDDAAYAERYVRERFERAGYGPARIVDELCRRGIERTMAEDAVGGAIDAGAERRRAEELLNRYLATRRGDGDGDRDRAAAYRYLARRGFDEAVLCDLLGVS